MTVGRLQASISLVFVCVFLLLGSLINGSNEERLLVTAFSFCLVASFVPRLSVFSGVVMDKRRDLEGVGLVRIVDLCLCVGIALSAVVLFRTGVPILATSVESTRLQPVVRWGPIYRVMNDTFFLAGAGYALLYGARSITTRQWIVRFSTCVFAIAALGFRSRLLDIVAVGAISFVLTRYSKGTVKLGPRVWLAISLGIAGALIGIVALTAIRSTGAGSAGAFSEAVDRALFLNQRVNLRRVYTYSSDVGFFYGRTFVEDLLSIGVPGKPSSQQVVTSYFNRTNSELFTMTPTIYGEFYLNFGAFSSFVVMPILLVYRLLAERVMLLLSQHTDDILWLAASVNVIYYVPRIMVTGGVNSSYYVKFGSIVMAMMVATVISRVVFSLLPKKLVLSPPGIVSSP